MPRAFTLIRPSELTLAELGELHAAYDGPVPPQAIADKIRMRPVRDEKYLREEIESTLTQGQTWANFLHEDRQKPDNDWAVDFNSRKLAECTRRVQALRDELEALEAPAFSQAAE